jgi:hypothetical protein
MNRLQSELRRLYLLPSSEEGGGLADATGQVRALVMELTGPADWEPLSRVWRGVQLDFELPAPAIAVSGSEGLQLWFSLQQPVSAASGAEFLAGLRSRYLADLAPATRLRLSPPDSTSPVPAEQATTGNWSAFVAPDLAPVFADTPWLDIPPGIEGQADLLARLESIKPAALAAAMEQMQPSGGGMASCGDVADASDLDPRRFLQRVLNDETLPLALRVEAAKALIQS